MNKKLSPIYLVLIIASFSAACNRTGKAEDQSNASPGIVTLHPGNKKYLAIDTKESIVTWKGSNAFGTHEGYVSISKGELMIEKGKLRGGAVEVNTRTIEDENQESNSGLIKHLKDPDFFDVQRFPTAVISITKAEEGDSGEIKITADLTIKSITNPVGFPVKMEINDGVVKATGKLVIDRTLWDVRYGSGKFFDNLKDKAISDSIEFNVRIIAKK